LNTAHGLSLRLRIRRVVPLADVRAINSGWRWRVWSEVEMAGLIHSTCNELQVNAKCLKYAKRKSAERGRRTERWTLNSSLDRWFKSHLSAEQGGVSLGLGDWLGSVKLFKLSLRRFRCQVLADDCSCLGAAIKWP